jgi:hypothetical protein
MSVLLSKMIGTPLVNVPIILIVVNGPSVSAFPPR